MRIFLLFTLTSILLLLGNITYSQEAEECGIDDPNFVTQEQLAAQRDIDIAVRNIISAKRAGSRTAVEQEYYIPVIVNLFIPPNVRNEGVSSKSGYDTYSREHALWVIDKLNETYNTSYGVYTTGNQQIGFQDDTAKINFIPATLDIDGNPGLDFFRVWNLEDYADDIPDFTNDCVANNPNPYYSFENDYAGQTTEFWFPYIGSSPTYQGYNVVVWNSYSCMDARSESSSYLNNTLSYYPDDYLNLNVMFGVFGGIAGFASLPGFGNLCYLRQDTYRDYKATVPHEVGHWLGLYHSWSYYNCGDALNEFQNENPQTCQISGDKVCDTYPTRGDSHSCYSTSTGDHCNVYEELLPTEHWNIMDYTQYCTNESFSPGQMERMRTFLETYPRSIVAQRGLLQFLSESCGDPNACNYSSNVVSYDPANCRYLDALGICGGTCAEDLDSDGICDDVDGCITINGNVDLNGNGICDNVDPCGSLSEIDGIFNNDAISAPVPVMPIGNRCWSSMNLRVDRFRNGEYIASAQDREEYRQFTETENPVRAQSSILADNKSEPSPSFVFPTTDFIKKQLYNWYVVTDPRGICPSGWHVSTDEDWIDLERAIGYQENEIIRTSRSENVVPGEALMNELKFSNVTVDYFTDEVFEDTWPWPAGFVDKYGIPRRHAMEEFIWTTKEREGGGENVYFRRLESPLRWIPNEELFTIQESANTAIPEEWRTPSVNREYRLNSTSGSKYAAMSIRCVKDVN